MINVYSGQPRLAYYAETPLKSIPALHVVAGNPARVIKKITKAPDPTLGDDDLTAGAESAMADLASEIESGSKP